MKILIDLDDTMENLTDVWVTYLSEKYKLNVKPEDIVSWNMSDAFPTLTHNQIFGVLGDRELWGKVEPLPYAQEVIKRLIEEGNDVYVVTASYPKTFAVKQELILDKYFPFIDWGKIIITLNKQMIIGDVLIDDAPHNLTGGVYKGILMTAHHNNKISTKTTPFRRADNWKQVYQMLSEMA